MGAAIWLGVRWHRRNIKFEPSRKWRFDFAWPTQKVAVEIDGLRYDGKAGHQTVKGVLNDAEKYEAALLLGWKVYRVPGPWIAEAKGDDVRLIWREEVMDTLKTLLGAT